MEYKDRCMTYKFIGQPMRKRIIIEYTKDIAKYPEDMRNIQKQIIQCINESFPQPAVEGD